MSQSKHQFNNFKIHTQYSICEGAIKIDDLANYCKNEKIKSIGICDSFNLCGALEFAEKISKVGTQPIIGSQINFSLEDTISKIPIFAQNENGYKNLIKLSSSSFLDIKETETPHCKLDNLFSNNLDLIVLSGGVDDFFGTLFKKNKIKKIEELFSKFEKVFSNRFYLELQRHNDDAEKNYEEFLISISNKYDLPIIASQETYYLKKEMHEAHDALICIGEKNFVDENNRKKFSNQHYLKKNHEQDIVQ